MRLRAHLVLGLFGLVTIGGFVGCGSVVQGDPANRNGNDPGDHAGTSPPAGNEEPFESDDPSPGAGSSFGDGAMDAGAPVPEGAPDGDGVEREIAEADIVQLSGNRLYALSRVGGLSVIDVGTKDKLRLLGRLPTKATPFEMYVRGDLLIAMFSDWSKVVYDAASPSYEVIGGSEILALDVSDPANIREIGRFQLPGEISDSRIVGDVLYTVSYQDGFCWQCKSQPTTVVTSLDISDPSAIRRVDELDFTSTHNQYGWGKRSVTVTPERMYVAGREYGPYGESSSTIQIVDIDDAKGDLKLGASVQATGAITSRWQMDEYDGVLRVISQPNQWDLSKPPRVQTFEVVSSDELRPLGSLDLTLPRPEELKSVRFDGTRAYAITFERTDPLFTIDLSNPSAPEQKGELEIPGWVHHMEPRGDRLYGLGFENGNKEGSLHVSIFDVSDLSKPTMLDRVNFGENWSFLGEDQSRIHKAFQIVPDANLILVPYSGHRSSGDCRNVLTSGVQLIDLVGDSLKKRGVAPSRGEARRAFLHQDRLFTVNDESAQVFDIDNRDVPVSTASMKLAHRVDRLLPAGENLVRIALDWWTGAAALEVVRAKDATEYKPLGILELDAAMASSDDDVCGYGAGRYYHARMFVDGNRVYVLVPSQYWAQNAAETTLLVVDIENPTSPKILSRRSYGFTFTPHDPSGQSSSDSLVRAGSQVVRIGSSLAILSTSYDALGELVSEALHVLDLRDPSEPRHTKLTLPSAKGRTPLQAHGTTVMLGRWAPVPKKPSRVRFYVDRVDVSNPAAPKLLPSVNVPGSLLSFDEQSERLVTVDYRREVLKKQNALSCRERGKGAAFFDFSTGTCTIVHRSLELLDLKNAVAERIGSKPLPDELWVRSVVLGDDRVVFIPSGFYSPGSTDCFDCGIGYGDQPIFLIAGAREGELETRSISMSGQLLSFARIAVAGQRFVVASELADHVGLLDLRDFDAPKAVPLGEVRGFASDVVVQGDSAFVALGHAGVQTIELPR